MSIQAACSPRLNPDMPAQRNTFEDSMHHQQLFLALGTFI